MFFIEFFCLRTYLQKTPSIVFLRFNDANKFF